MSTISNPTVKQYVEARSRLHQEVVRGHLIGTAAQQSGDEIKLTQDVVSQGAGGDTVTFKSGSAYLLNPYATRTERHESVSFSADGQTTTIKHDYKPERFSTTESLDVQVHGGNGGGSSSSEETSYGWHPHGWVQNNVQHEDGYILTV